MTHDDSSDALRATAEWTILPCAEFVPPTSPLAPLNGHVLYSSAGFKISAPPDQLKLVPSSKLAELQDYIAQANKQVADGTLEVLSDGTARIVPSVQSGEAGKGPVRPEVTFEGPHGYIKSHWYGWQAHMDAYLANKLIGGTWVGDAGAFAATYFRGAPPIFGIALAGAAGALQLCQAEGGSLDVYWLSTITPTAFVCNPFA